MILKGVEHWNHHAVHDEQGVRGHLSAGDMLTKAVEDQIGGPNLTLQHRRYVRAFGDADLAVFRTCKE